jgi:8-oxo-dGTP pyrophosphatase MutT (NUDIX family)
MPFLENIRPFKTADLTGFVPVLACGLEIGHTKADFAKTISNFDTTWRLTAAGLELSQELKTFDDRTKAVDRTFETLSAAGILPVMPDYTLTGGSIDWVSAFPNKSFDALFTLKRFYFVYLGLQTYSIMLNGFTKTDYWSGTRSMNVHNNAGKMDVIAAGMLRHGETVQEALIHESYEEAGLLLEDLSGVTMNGQIDLSLVNKEGFLLRESFHVFDLDLKDKSPVVVSPNEVEKFTLLKIDAVLKYAEAGDVFSKPVNLVITDFLIRHGHLTAAHPEFEQIKEILYRPTI